MNKMVMITIIALITTRIIQAQGILYLSNLGQPVSGSYEIGNNSWYAVELRTGNNPAGYTLDSVQLAIADASGNPSGFTVMLYSAVISAAVLPGSSLGSLNGSANPSTVGIYTYSDDSNITLSPNTHYYLVLASGTMVGNGAYEWSEAGSYTQNGNWFADAGPAYSTNGSNWSFVSGYPQFSLTATAIPEPSAWSLILLGGGVFLYVRTRKQHAT